MPHNRTRNTILDATREVIIREGATKLTVSGVAKTANITRSLFYHYFATKEEAIEAVLDHVIDDFLSELKAWNDAREPGNIDKALEEATALMRKILNDDGPFATSLARTRNAELYLEFTDRAARRISHYISETTVRDYKEKHPVHITHVEETFYMLLTGLTALIRTNPDIDDAIITHLIAQTLHIDEYLHTPLS